MKAPPLHAVRLLLPFRSFSLRVQRTLWSHFFLILIITAPLCLTHCSSTRQKKRENYQAFLNVLTPHVVNLYAEQNELGGGDNKLGETLNKVALGELPNSEIRKCIKENRHVAEKVLSGSFDAHLSDSLALFVSDPLLDLTIKSYDEARATLHNWAENSLSTLTTFELYLKTADPSLAEELAKKHDERLQYHNAFLDHLGYAVTNCSWLIVKYDLVYDKSATSLIYEPQTLERQRGKPSPYREPNN